MAEALRFSALPANPPRAALLKAFCRVGCGVRVYMPNLAIIA